MRPDARPANRVTKTHVGVAVGAGRGGRVSSVHTVEHTHAITDIVEYYALLKNTHDSTQTK